jgi:hypothetical protein
LSDRRKAVVCAFWVGLFWVAFLFWGLWCLQVASGKVIERHKKSIKDDLFYLPLTDQEIVETRFQRFNRARKTKVTYYIKHFGHLSAPNMPLKPTKKEYNAKKFIF